jgi:spermidine synthase
MRRTTILVLFFLSGAAALIHQIVWVRQSVLIFGVSVYAYSAVLTAFMGGAALGSYWFSRRADQTSAPLRLFALLQLGVALLGGVAPHLLSILRPLYAEWAQALPPGLLPLSLIRLLLALVALTPAAILIGATLPVMVRAYAQEAGRIGSDVGRLYAADTLGAALGCALAGLLLIRLVGTQATAYVAVGLNLLIGVSAWWLARTGPPPASRVRTPTKPVGQVGTTRSEPLTLPFFYALSGFAALGYEIVWSRILAIFTLNAIFSFSIMLTTYLIGLTLGGWLGAWWVRRRPVTLQNFGWLQLALALAALLTLYLFWLIPNRVTLETVFGVYTIANLIAFEFLLGFLVLLIPTTLLGLLFPLVVSLYTGEQQQALGRRIGLLYALNTVGAVAGALLTGFVLIPWLGLQRTTIGLSLINLLIGGASFWLADQTKAKSWWAPAGAASAFLALVLLLPPGYYLGFRADPPDNLTFYAEGVETTVAVFEVPAENFKVSFVNGRIEVPTDPVSMRAFRLLGHLPALLRPDAERALMLSFGNGVASGSLDTHGIAQIDAVDLSAEQFAAAARYWQENYNVLRSAHLQTHVEDGRNFLLQTTTRYDIITTDATHPVNTSSWALFTLEFYQNVAERLAPDGVFLQWLPFHNLREADYKAILRTVQTVFPHTTLWYTGGSHTLVLATPEPLTPAELVNLFAAGATKQTVVQDLGPPNRWPEYLVMGERTLRDYTGAGPLVTDNNAFFLPDDRDNLRIMQTMEAAVQP